jgi:hypothetical protein
VPRKLTLGSPTPSPYAQKLTLGACWQSALVQEPSGFWWSFLPAFLSRTAVGGLSAGGLWQPNWSLVVPDFTLTTAISSPAPPSIEKSGLSTSSSLTTRPSAWWITTCEMSLLEWASKSLHESLNDAVTVA